MQLGGDGYSPGVLKKIEYAGGNHRSFAAASEALERLAEVSISDKHVERLTECLGRERAAARDGSVAAMKAAQLRSVYKQPPAVAVISIDAGKAQFRDEDKGKGPGVRGARWGDTKVACLQTYTHVEYDKDPQPEPPEAFLNPARVERLSREMQKIRGTGVDKPDKPPKEKEPEQLEPLAQKKKKKNRPQRLVRTVVATTAKVEEFGWMVSAEAMHRKMYAAPRRAIVGDGGNWIEPLGQLHFPDWIQILDFLHLLVHLFAAARLAYAGDSPAAWKLYEQMLRDAWGGRVQAVIDQLQSQLQRLAANKTTTHKDAVDVVELAMNYVERNRQRVDYPRYRQLGLPVGSAQVESLIKQVNHRIKGTEQFWNDGGLEAVLQVRAAYLSEDERAEKHHEHRPRAPAVGRNRSLGRTKTGMFQAAE